MWTRSCTARYLSLCCRICGAKNDGAFDAEGTTRLSTCRPSRNTSLPVDNAILCIFGIAAYGIGYAGAARNHFVEQVDESRKAADIVATGRGVPLGREMGFPLEIHKPGGSDDAVQTDDIWRAAV